MEMDPVSLTLDELMQLDGLALHHLAKKSAGTLTRYQALLGRVLLAMERSGAYLEHGCSGGVHYAVLQLGMSTRKARLLLRVARELENLPYLRYLANFGEIDWSKLREIVRVATADTERAWAQLCCDHSYAQIEDLVARSQRGEIPEEREVACGPRSQFRCHFGPEQMAVVERGLQVMCQASGRALSMAEGIELLFAEKLAEKPVEEDDELQTVRQEALRDLRWTDVIQADIEPIGPIDIVNPTSRVPSKAQRRKILRRDGYCCGVPGCPNTLWLEVHHIIVYADGGLTRPENLITLCTRCHKHVHEGHLTIRSDAPHGVRFFNRILETAFWLDHWCGWRGGEYNCRYFRARDALELDVA